MVVSHSSHSSGEKQHFDGVHGLLVQEPQREQLSALLDNIYSEFVATVAGARGKSEADVGAMLDEGIYGIPSPLNQPRVIFK